MSQRALVELSRWQWALTASFHMTFPAVTVGTSVFPVACYGAYMRTKQAVYLHMFRFWRRIFGIGFALGVVSGIVLTFEFGLNWGRFAHDVGPILGVIIGMEVLTAFFLEAGLPGCWVGSGTCSPPPSSSLPSTTASPSRSPGPNPPGSISDARDFRVTSP